MLEMVTVATTIIRRKLVPRDSRWTGRTATVHLLVIVVDVVVVVIIAGSDCGRGSSRFLKERQQGKSIRGQVESSQG